MIVTKSYKLRLYPTKEQKVFFNKTMGCSRVIYNEMLYNLSENYKNGIKKDKFELFKEIRTKYEWMKKIDSIALYSSFMDLDSAYQKFFKKQSKFPKFKKKKDKNTYRNTTPRKIKNVIKGNFIKLSVIGLVKFRQDYNFEELNIVKYRNYTIERSKTNKYYCSICVDVDIPEYKHTGEVLGIDLGIKDLVIDSNGNKYSNPKYQAKAEKKIKHLQRLYSKKQKGSKNQEKARLKFAIAHEKLSNKRKDYLHKITTKLIKENDIICIENLNVKGMAKNHHLAKAIQNASFGTLISMLKYKAKWHNRQIIEIGRFYPSSKICNCCGNKMNYMGLEVREWSCPVCGEHHDRDINAAINIKNEGLRILDNVKQSTDEVSETNMLVENPTMDDKSAMTLKSSDSMKQETKNKR